MPIESGVGPDQHPGAGRRHQSLEDGQRIPDQPRGPARGADRTAAQPLTQDHRGRGLGAGGGQQGVEPTDPGVPVPGTLLLVAVDLDDRVVHININEPRIRTGSAGASQQRGPAGQVHQEPGGDRVELAHVPEGELTQERAQGRGRIAAVEHPFHRPVAQHGHVIDRVRPRAHPGHQGRDLRPGVGALVGRHAQPTSGQLVQAGLGGQFHHRHQPGGPDEVRLVEGN